MVGRRFLPRLFSLLLCAAPASAAGSVRIAGAPAVVHKEIQAAVDAAVEGDVLLVAHGTYLPFTIDGKSLSVVAMPGATATVTGTITVKNLGAQQVVRLVGMQASALNNAAGMGFSALLLTQNAGHVHVRDSVFTGGRGAYGEQSGSPGGHGIWAIQSDRVVIVECTLVGGRGGWGGGMFVGTGGPGGNGLQTNDSRASIHASDLTGGVGGDGHAYGGRGGHGYGAYGQGPFASGSTFQGGQGGEADPSYGWTSGGGGVGMSTHTGPAELLACSLFGGAPGTPWGVVRPGPAGQPLAGPANTHGGIARPLSIARLVVGSGTAAFQLTGVPGDQVALLAAARLEFLFVPGLVGTWVVPLPFFGGAQPTGVVGGLGVLAGAWRTPDLRPGRAAQGFALQAVATAGGAARLSDPNVCVLLDRDAGPDCNLNGVNDFVDLIEGTSTDVDHNLVPDDCESNWYVDPAAAPGGTGHPSLPFQTLKQAMQVASSGDEIILMDGLYTGPDNRSLSFAGRDLFVHSFSGPANCVIDLQGAGNAFSIGSGGRVEGLTIVNGSATRGGALYITSGTVTVADCVFSGNFAAQEGGALYVLNAKSVIEDCRFVGNSAGAGAGGGGLYLSAIDARVRRCVFEGNGNGGMTLRAYTAGGGTAISHCTFDGNTSSGDGAGLRVFGFAVTTPTSVVNCLFTGNSGARGGGLAVDFAPLTVADCTFGGNTAQQGGGALFVDRGHSAGDVVFANSILWGDAGGEIFLLDATARLAVDSCDVQGGQAGVSVAPGATLLWGQGNLAVDPLFTSAGDLRLQFGSPCIDAGDNALLPPDLADVDGDGDVSEPLPLDLDLAARRFDVPQIPDTGFGAAPIVDMGAFEAPAPYSGPIWHVDPGAGVGGYGAMSSPFATIAEAVSAASSGHMIKLAPGTYKGPGNRNLDLGTKELIVKSAQGPLTTVIDCEGQGRAFRVAGGQTSATMIADLAIRNGSEAQGGAIFVSGASPLLANCIFVDCAAASSGGALYATSSALRIERCTFLGNTASPGSNNAGGAGIGLFGCDARVLRCLFDGNDVLGAGGGLLDIGGSSVVSHSTFRNNSAFRGGGAYVRDSVGPVGIVDCQFEGNAASRGGGLASQNAWGDVALCTFGGNNASEGGALYAWSTPAAEWVLSNSILWGDAAPTGGEIAFNGSLRVEASDVAGSLAGVAVGSLGPVGTLTWGPANIDADPLFNAPGDYRLQPLSPCIDAGDNTLVPPDLTDVDGDGIVTEPVPLDLDLLGRFFDVPTAPNTGNGPRPLVDMGAYEARTP